MGTGRYTRPTTKNEERLCKICNAIEDEKHAIYFCRAHRLIRENYKNILNFGVDLKELLNPRSVDNANKLAMYLQEIEENMKELEMI